MLMPQMFFRLFPERPPPLKCDESFAQLVADLQEKTVDIVHRPKQIWPSRAWQEALLDSRCQ